MTHRVRCIAALALTVLASACDKAPDPVPLPAPHAPAQTPAQATPAATAAIPTVADAYLITPEGVAGIAVGAAWNEVAAKFNPKGHMEMAGIAEGCDIYDRLDERISAMVEDGKVTRVETRDAKFRTANGVGVGSSPDALRKAYGARLTDQENEYSGRDFFVWQAKGRGIKFHVDDGRVSNVTAGSESIRYIEGCL